MELVKKYLLDTNSIIYALNNGYKFPNYDYAISVISEIELLSYSKLTLEDEHMLKTAIANFRNINITSKIKEETIKIRKHSKLKLPDSLIDATAFTESAILITSDQQLLNSNLTKTIELKNLK